MAQDRDKTVAGNKRRDKLIHSADTPLSTGMSSLAAEWPSTAVAVVAAEVPAVVDSFRAK